LDGENELLDAKLCRLEEAFRAYLAAARDSNFAAREAALAVLEKA
jgi:hypothetical protein